MSQKILMVIAPEEFRDEELNIPRHLFQARGMHVDVASTVLGEAKGMLGAKELIHLSLQTISSKDYDAILIVGGMGSPKHLWHNLQLHEIVRCAKVECKVIGAICLSGAALAHAGLLHGKKATVYETPEALEALKAGGAYYTAEPVTVDGYVITANGPEAAEAFGQAVLKVLQQQPASVQR